MSILQDSELDEYVIQEENRQRTSITLIASENYVFPGVYKYSGSLLTNKYSEGKVGARYYGGTKYIDIIESQCKDRILALFELDPSVWGVCVQSYSGSIANLSAYSAMVTPGGKIMGMNLPAGGHLTHGFQTKTRKVSGTSVYFSSHPYEVDANGYLDYNHIRTRFNEVSPEVLICGYSAHSQDINYALLRGIVTDKAFLYADISHISALIASKLMNNPFIHCDVVMTTTHKGLRGPRGAIIMYRKCVTVNGTTHDLDNKMNLAVFPLIQGGPHNHTIAGISHSMYMAKQPEFITYCKQVVSNARIMCDYFKQRNYSVVTDSTVNHMVIIDLHSKGVSGQEVESFCDYLGININKNSVPRDKSCLFKPSGIRLGVYAITTRGFKEGDTYLVCDMVHTAIMLLQDTVSARSKHKSVKDWIISEDILNQEGIKNIIQNIFNLTKKYPVPE
ncbi:serine hydroxymethyltransferase [Nematocida parisii ERTm1]|uniref:serine hydroxymethyltransferase n=1 Tax=Nematocida parisii (strain ERTm1 / ATCC PRA-289) TaxID=881290 RepID=UPI000264B89D|nr:serine hydroxymethyltransferase [Nematocida parisii ERTm1]EIJ93114.1 serine hydroxymethyltransferase [Nematocida parisii ERTm1]|eukprot:XP_013059897.1 serine hydroxymethyltransferase [Nematocida parisii ERTm1]